MLSAFDLHRRQFWHGAASAGLSSALSSPLSSTHPQDMLAVAYRSLPTGRLLCALLAACTGEGAELQFVDAVVCFTMLEGRELLTSISADRAVRIWGLSTGSRGHTRSSTSTVRGMCAVRLRRVSVGESSTHGLGMVCQ